MKYFLPAILSTVISFSIAHAQPAAAPGGPHFGGAMTKLFGDNQAFSASMEMQTKAKDDDITMPGKIMFDAGRSRFEMDMTQLKSKRINPDQAAQLKQFGMEKMVAIDRPDRKVTDLVYPGLESYVENPITDREMLSSANDFKVEITELGKETMDGHPCIKNKSVVTDKDGNKHESTVWNATDLKNFPVRIETTEQGNAATILFKDISFAKPDAKLFEVPTTYTKYDSAMTMMRDQMMKKMGVGIPGMGR